MKEILYDNGRKVSNISIICMFKNNENYLGEFFEKITTEMEEMYDTIFNYYIIENNSTDNTRNILRNFIKTKSDKSKLILFGVEKDYKNIGNGKNYDRLYNLSKIRNKLVNSITPLDSEWCLFIDSNIYFKKDILQKMFNKSCETIGMMVPYTQQLFIPQIHKNMNLDKPTLYKHFYDTFSFFDENNKTFWPYCAFERCKYCNRETCTNNMNTVKKEKDVVDVGSCFGGFALIRTEIINNPIIRWDTMSYDTIEKEESTCEHFIFCYLLKKITDKRIVVLQNIDEIYRTY